MKKAIAVILCGFALVALFPKVAIAEELSPTEKIKEYDFSKFEEYFSEVKYNFGSESFSEFAEKLLSGEVDGKEIFSSFIGVALGGIKSVVPLIGILVVLSLIYGVLGNAKGDFFSGELGFAIRLSYTLAASLTLCIYVGKAFETAAKTMLSMKNQMFATFPFLITLLYAGGGEVTATSVQPVLYFLSVSLTGIIQSVVQPLYVFSFLVGLFSRLSEKTDFSKIADFSKNLSNTVLTVSLVVFTAYLAISGSFSISRDGAMYKAARYALSQGVPIVGTYLREGIDMVVLCSVEIKNAVGTAALLVFLALSLSPVVKCYALSLAIKLSAALASPFSDEKTVKFLDGAAKSVDSVGASLLCVLLMYMESVLVLIAATRYVL